MAIAALAKEARLARWTVAHALTPHGRAPGASTARRLQRWLADTHAAPEVVAEAAIVPAGPPAEPPAPLADIDGVIPRHLSQAQRDKLGGYLSFDDRQIRTDLDVSREAAEKAFHGQELAAEIVGRITQALDGHSAPSGG
jgi:hypothetical protein